MGLRVSISRVSLSYADGLVLHTASSGAVPALDELRLCVERNGELVALGATRVNIAYLTGLPPEQVVADCLAAAASLDWSAPPAHLIPALDAAFPHLPAVARMLFEMAAQDAAARTAGQSLCEQLGGQPQADVPSNQTLFHAPDDDALLRRAEGYVARGFLDLKLRVGFGPFADDLSRLHLLRAHLGKALALSIDANGSWTEAKAATHLDALAPLALHYAEQPIPPGDWDAVARLSRRSPVPIMLDESLNGMAAVEHLAATRAAPLAHLKLAKLGGLDRLMAAGRLLARAGISVMVGQMNEGVVSTLAAAHAAAALGAERCELYGADGLAADPAGALHYASGRLKLPPGPGLGLTRHGAGGTLLWEYRV